MTSTGQVRAVLERLLFGLRLAGIGSLAAGAVLGGCGVESSEKLLEFSALRVEEIGALRAVVRFTTSVESTCELEYGASRDRLTLRATDPDMDPLNPYSIDHQVPLEDLEPDTQVFYRARATTRSETTYFSEVDSFETQAPDSADSTTSPIRGMTNIALLSAGAQISEVSSNFGGAGNGETWGADAALDGLMGTEWSSNGDGDAAFLILEWSEPQAFRALGYRSRKMADGSSIVKSVRLVLDGGQQLGPFVTPDPDEHYVFEFDGAVVAQRVRLEAVNTTGGNTGAKEIELFVVD